MQALRAAARVALRRRTITTTAAVCTELGAPLTVRDDWKIEEPGPGEVLVRTRAAGLNFAEVLQTKGLYQERLEPPFVPGNECSGTVEAVGAGVAHVKAGDAVIALPRGGAWARHCVVNGAAVAPLPKIPKTEAEWRQAASLAVAYGTADMALRRRARMSEGETVLITAAAGGVGLAAVELAAHAGSDPCGNQDLTAPARHQSDVCSISTQAATSSRQQARPKRRKFHWPLERPRPCPTATTRAPSGST